ncbi:MAG: DUF885 domain-containing protein [Anaeromyxobacteraceae bacterium]
MTLALVAALALSAAPPLSPADAAFETLTRDYLREFGKYSPVGATQLGEHRFDAELDDLSAEGRAAALAWTRSWLERLNKLDRAHLSRANQADVAILENQLRAADFYETKLQDWAWNPLVYTGLAGDALYSLLAREYAPLPQRLLAVAARLEKLPRLLAQERANLVLARVPAIHAETAVKQNPGVLSLVDELVVPNLKVLPDADRARLEKAIAGAKAALAEHQRWLEGTMKPAAKGEFRIGAKLYDEKLRFSLMSPLSRQEVRRRAEAEVKRVRAEMYAVSTKALAGKPGAPPAPARPTAAEQQAVIAAALELAYADRPPRDAVVETAKKTLAEATAFVRQAGFVTVPDEPVDIIVMPEFQRGVALAYCDSPGALDRGQRTFYAVSPIPADWTEKQVDSFLREYNERSIANLTLHEAMPGHYLQGAHANRSPFSLRNVFQSGSFVEGWAEYGERITIDAGFRAADPLMRLIQLKWYLRATTNAIIDSAIHVDGMTRDAAMKLMTETAFQEEREAAAKWVRAELTSAQLSTYFVGYQEHADLRAYAEKKLGKKFDARAYHDQLLSYGAPPVRIVRALMFGEPIK